MIKRALFLILVLTCLFVCCGRNVSAPEAEYYTINGIVGLSDDPADSSGSVVVVGGKVDTTNAHGAYSITDIAAGTYTIIATHDGYISSDTVCDVDENTMINFTLEIEPESGFQNGQFWYYSDSQSQNTFSLIELVDTLRVYVHCWGHGGTSKGGLVRPNKRFRIITGPNDTATVISLKPAIYTELHDTSFNCEGENPFQIIGVEIVDTVIKTFPIIVGNTIEIPADESGYFMTLQNFSYYPNHLVILETLEMSVEENNSSD